MDELGQILREARETKGFSLAEVQERIRINAKFLKALENGEYETLPTPIHVRGFLRNYARFLGLDPQPLLDRYELNQRHRLAPVMAMTENDITPRTPLPPRPDQPFFNPVNVEVNDGQRNNAESILRLVIILALVIAIALVANRFIPLFLGNGDGSAVITEGITGALQNIVNNDNESAGSQTELDGASTFTPGEVITSTSRNDFGVEGLTPSPTRPPLPATMETVRLKLEITERAWLEVTIDGDIVFSGIAVRGDPPYEWEAQEEAKVVTGNAVGIFVTINDIQLGRMGERGENKEEVWQATN
jgi:transcriptional regulator with XRE-family HTH domain